MSKRPHAQSFEPNEEAQANVKEKKMFAVIKTGGKQYRVQEGDVVAIEKLEADVDSKVTFDDVLMAGEGDNVKIGTPSLSGASVEAKVVNQMRTRKVLIFKKRRRQNSQRKNGHRQHLTVVEITGIKA